MSETGEGLGREREGMDRVESPQTDFDEVVLRLEKVGEEGFASHRGGEHSERERASLQDPGEIGWVVSGGEFEAEVGEVAESLEGTVEEAEKVACEDVFVPLEVESTDKRGIKIVASEGFDEAQCSLWGDVDEGTVQYASGDLVEERAGGEYRKKIAPRNVSENELQRLWREHLVWQG